MARISLVDVDTLKGKELEAVQEHLREGYRLSNEKRTLLHNAEAFRALEESSYRLDRELQRLIGKRAGDFFEYAISLQNECLVCTTYFSELLEKNGIDFQTFEFTDRENLLIEYARAMAADPKAVSDDLFRRLKAEFTQEELVVITAMGVIMIANNYFNDILQIEP